MARDLELLRKLGVTHILNATSEVRNYFEKEPGFTYHKTPCMDTDAADLSPFFNSAVDFISDARKEGHSVLVHCFQGVSRSATLVIAYLIKVECKTLSEAYTLVKATRPTCKVRPNFLKQLIEFEKKVKSERDDGVSSGMEVRPSEKPNKRKETEDVSSEKSGEQKEVSTTKKAAKGPMGPQLPPTKLADAAAVAEVVIKTPKTALGPQLPARGPQPSASSESSKGDALSDQKAAFFARKVKAWGSAMPGL